MSALRHYPGRCFFLSLLCPSCEGVQSTPVFMYGGFSIFCLERCYGWNNETSALLHMRSVKLIFVIPKPSRMLYLVMLAFASMTVLHLCSQKFRILHNICSLHHGQTAGQVFFWLLQACLLLE